MVICMKVPPFSLSKQLSDLGPDLDAAVLKVLQSGQYIGGQEVQAFEESFAQIIGVANAVSCNSGTDALVLALRALEIGPGDEVITCSFSFFATAEAISLVGARPVFVDINPANYLIDFSKIEKAITSATKAILPVHLFGCPVDMDQLMKLANEKGLKVIEDCAQASGAKWNGKSVGNWGDIGCFSFFPTKNLGAAGDGGMATTQDDGLARRMKELAVHGMPRRYLHTALGYNSRLDAIQAAVLNVKLPKLNEWIQQRKDIARRYLEALKDFPGIELPSLPDERGFHAWNQFVVRIKRFEVNNLAGAIDFRQLNLDFRNGSTSFNPRDCLKECLQQKGINTIIYYPIPIHEQPAYGEFEGIKPLPVTEKSCKQVLSLPIFPEITVEEQDYVIDTLGGLLRSANIT